ncbi:SusD/RagB family nutrient-binding outer membrane lipoprotein [Dysgonomonas sp. 521]|uniref:SusD/RagB family nutrient-binding outer membrane lipoprotein n=1 Tax=Dysgonomonas sp. 521 TaxID=2302932 RepID=UPI0013D6566F|nr:SusD/RagB family nutrient-binding outer membrane lipoprotein [Dysgonomonas sp. 521]NDV94221.1 SusD/RagB family nutrient-binding outer membrane lipoprotein [Dysgonomonas sp. 521]
MKNIKKIVLVLFVGVLLGSCTKGWLDINEDPNKPTAPVLSQILSFSETQLAGAMGQGNYLGTVLSSVMHQSVSRESQNYGIDMQDNNTYNSWNTFYLYTLKDLDALIDYAELDGNLIYAGIGKTLKAYTVATMVDLWGDIPYSEYNVVGINEPKVDSGKDIYNALFVLLDEAKSDLQNKDALNIVKPGSDDFFYGGNVDKWIRLNNTIQLKMLLQTRKVKADISDWQAKFNALVSANNFIASGEDFEFWYNEKTSPSDMRHPAFRASGFYTGQHTFYISPYFYETMMGQTYNTTDNPFAGIKDPRVPYYFVNQLSTGTEPANPYEYRNGNFLSMFFASNGPNNSSSNDGSFTKVGIYANGGKYDNGKGGAVSLKTGTGVAPTKIITYQALKFMLAELVLAGETGGDAKALLKEGITAAFAHVNTVVEKQPTVPELTDDDRDAYITSVLAKYDAANAEGKMRIVMTQKWIAGFMSPIDTYTDYRRTGYPTLFDPSKTQNPGYGVNLVVADRSPEQVPLLKFASFPRSLYYPNVSEITLNSNIEQKTNLASPFVFWDK